MSTSSAESDFLGASARLTAAIVEVENKIAWLKREVAKLDDWRTVTVVSIVGRETSYPDIMQTEMFGNAVPHINASVMNELSLALEAYHRVRQEAYRLWAALPSNVRQGHPEPK